MKNVANCPKCGQIFVKALRPICQQCSKEQEENFGKVSNFIRWKQNRMATLQEVHEKTGVPLTQIHQFIKEKRILVKHFPNLGYPCESCGTLIKEGRICESCTTEIKEGLERVESEKEFEQRKAAQEKARAQTYHSLNDRIT